MMAFRACHSKRCVACLDLCHFAHAHFGVMPENVQQSLYTSGLAEDCSLP